MKTDHDMLNQIIRALDEGTPDGHQAYDVEMIKDACHQALINSVDPWDLDLLDSDLFWELIKTIECRIDD